MSILGVDVGGTFTDIVSWDGKSITATKVATTEDPSAAIESVLVEPYDQLVHGTTVATNALLQRRGGTTALVTSQGFTDVIEIGRQDRPSLYDGNADRAPALVPREARFAATELDRVVSANPDAVAVALLGAHLDATPEREVATQLRSLVPDALVSLSSEVSPEVREFERTSTTILNAYLRPAVSEYLGGLTTLDVDHISVMRSSGGLMALERAAAIPAAILLSGPAGGAMATAALASSMGLATAISFDMGGTSTDVSRIEEGRPEIAYERAIDGYACRLPAVAIHTVGAGGGSIAWRDTGGALKVGPASAGADPGPASYGRGGHEPTVTDANVVLGRLPPSLAAGLHLDMAAAVAALERLDMGSAAAAANGITSIVEENMAAAIRVVSIEDGVDPAQATLIAFGGAGGLHATALARRLGISRVIVPPLPGVFSALGLLLSPPRADATIAVAPNADEATVTVGARQAANQAASELQQMTGSVPTSVATYLDVRFRGQSHELTVPWEPGDGWAALLDRFNAQHLRRNGFSRVDDPLEIVAARAEAIGVPAASLSDLEVAPTGEDPNRGHVELIEDDVLVTASLWWRPGLSGEVRGPAIIAEPTCTTYIRSDERAVVLANGAVELQW